MVRPLATSRVVLDEFRGWPHQYLDQNVNAQSVPEALLYMIRLLSAPLVVLDGFRAQTLAQQY